VVLPLPQPTVRHGLVALAAHDVQSVLLEGGPTLQRAAIVEELVDEVQLYVSPRVLGRKGVGWTAPGLPPLRLDGVAACQVGRDVVLEAYVQRTH
jgi:riboflavin biosynthesis pyrimidine reductase